MAFIEDILDLTECFFQSNLVKAGKNATCLSNVSDHICVYNLLKPRAINITIETVIIKPKNCC